MRPSSPRSRLEAGIALLGNLGAGASAFTKTLGLSPEDAPELNALRMANSIWEACGRDEYAAVEIPVRSGLVPDTDEAVIEAMLGSAPADAPTRKACWAWATKVDSREYANASRLGGLLWAVDLYGFADATRSDPEIFARRRSVAVYCREQYGIEADPPPQIYVERGGNPWALVRLCRRFDIMSRSIREREIVVAVETRSRGGDH